MGNALERLRGGEAKWILSLPEKCLHVSNFLIAEHRLSGTLVIFYPLINCCTGRDDSSEVMVRGKATEGEERSGVVWWKRERSDLTGSNM